MLFFDHISLTKSLRKNGEQIRGPENTLYHIGDTCFGVQNSYSAFFGLHGFLRGGSVLSLASKSQKVTRECFLDYISFQQFFM